MYERPGHRATLVPRLRSNALGVETRQLDHPEPTSRSGLFSPTRNRVSARRRHDHARRLGPGYLYIVDEPVHPDDVYPHPHPINESRWEWLTKRPLRLALVERTEVQPDERLTDGEQVELRRRQIEAGEENFAARD